MLVLVGILGRGLAALDSIYFSRHAARYASSIPLTTQNAFVYRLRRSPRYSLNFYLHRELPEWEPQQKNAAVVFTPLQERPALEAFGLRCDQESYPLGTSVIVCVREQGPTVGMAGGEAGKN
jgi:hypothetical protein